MSGQLFATPVDFGVRPCQGCNKVHHVPKACGNRHCPSCQGDKARNWLAQQQARLLPCAYFMLTFTVPSQLRRFIRSHPKECYRALLEAAYQSMATLASDRRFMGSSNIGATGVLHTWGRDMNYHLVQPRSGDTTLALGERGESREPSVTQGFQGEGFGGEGLCNHFRSQNSNRNIAGASWLPHENRLEDP